jgi:hypothetical protein
MTPLESEVWNKFSSLNDDVFLSEVIDESVSNGTSGVVIVEMDSAPVSIDKLERNVVLAVPKPYIRWSYLSPYLHNEWLTKKFDQIFNKHIFPSVHITVRDGMFSYSSYHELTRLNGQGLRIGYNFLRMIETNDFYYLFIPLGDIKLVADIKK